MVQRLPRSFSTNRQTFCYKIGKIKKFTNLIPIVLVHFQSLQEQQSFLLCPIPAGGSGICPFHHGVPLVINVGFQAEIAADIRLPVRIRFVDPFAVQVEHCAGGRRLWGAWWVDGSQAGGCVRQNVEMGGGWRSHGGWARVYVNLKSIIVMIINKKSLQKSKKRKLMHAKYLLLTYNLIFWSKKIDIIKKKHSKVQFKVFINFRLSVHVIKNVNIKLIIKRFIQFNISGSSLYKTFLKLKIFLLCVN